MPEFLHLSDMHFGSGEHAARWFDTLKEPLVEKIIELDKENLYLIVSGDISFKGAVHGYDLADDFFKDLLRKTSLRKDRIILCPGNHDICKSKRPKFFDKFDELSYRIREDDEFLYSERSASFYVSENICFLGINSSYHFDHQYGLAPVDEIDKILRSKGDIISGLETKIAVIHHHLFNQFEEDCSVVRNSYNLLCLLDFFGFNYIFHGHQHAFQNLPVGKSGMRIVGVNSFNFSERRYVNGFNHYSVVGGGSSFNRYQYIEDLVCGGRVGGFCRI
jgi:DNA repair exonuclease SbcCD nuclease subunit